MNRRKFLKKTSSGVLAAAFLPLLSFDKSKPISLDAYDSVEYYKKNGREWLIMITINSDLLTNFRNIDKENRTISIESFDETSILTKYNIEKISEKTIEEKNLHFLTLKLLKDKNTEQQWDTGEELFGKEIELEIHDKCHGVIRNEKQKVSINLRYARETKEGDAECFLTTACVFHKGLADDCKELTTLRNLRATKMNPNPKYQKLISEYELVAPKMLINIDKAENRSEILDAIYAKLVLPSVALIEEGKNTEAIEYYADFVNEMKTLYL